MSERDQGGYAIRRTHKEKATHSHHGKLKPGAIDNDLWGPAAWLYLHTVTRAYPKEPTDEDKANYGAFFRAVAPTLPCPKCRANYTDGTPRNDPPGARQPRRAREVARGRAQPNEGGAGQDAAVGTGGAEGDCEAEEGEEASVCCYVAEQGEGGGGRGGGG